MADKLITNPLGAFGYTATDDLLYSLHAPFKASTDITGPCVVAMNTTGSVAAVATNASTAQVVGICINSPLSGGVADVVIMGCAKSVPVGGTISAGQILKVSVTTAGRVNSSSAPAAAEALGVAIKDGSAANGTVDMWVKFFG